MPLYPQSVQTAMTVALHSLVGCGRPVLLTWPGAQMVLKCADIGHLAADPKTHKRWASQLEEEFFRQVKYRLALTPAHSQHARYFTEHGASTQNAPRLLSVPLTNGIDGVHCMKWMTCITSKMQNDTSMICI